MVRWPFCKYGGWVGAMPEQPIPRDCTCVECRWSDISYSLSIFINRAFSL